MVLQRSRKVPRASVQKLADALGYPVDFQHRKGIFITTPKGKVHKYTSMARAYEYLNGVRRRSREADE